MNPGDYRRADARHALFLIAWLATTPWTPTAEAQLSTSVVQGRVLGPDGLPVIRARVALQDSLGQTIAEVVSDQEGRFRLKGVAPGAYRLGAAAEPMRSPWYSLAIRDGLPVELELRLSPQLSESVAVATDSPSSGGGAGTTLAGETVLRTGTPLRGGALRAAVAATPGWTSEDNGLMHYRGVDDGLLFVLDGIPVYERLDAQFGVGFDPSSLGSVRVLSGYVPPEFGLRSGGVIEVRSAAGTLDSWSGAIETGLASFRSQALSGILQGAPARNVTLTVNAGGERSRRFLDPITEGNRHNAGDSSGGEAELVWAPGHDVVTVRGGFARSAFDVPHTEEQERAGQDQRQDFDQSFATLNWQRSWSGGTSSQLAAFGRFTHAALLGSGADTPLFAETRREQDRFGLLASFGYARGRHRLKVGLEASEIRLKEAFRFFVTDREAGLEAGLIPEVLERGPDAPFDFADAVHRPILSFYAQDSWRPSAAVTVDAGLRYDRSRLLLSEAGWSPRLGISYRLGRATLRASLNRFFQPPQTEYLLLSSSREARGLSPFAAELGSGGAEVRAERQTAIELGGELRLGEAVRVDLAAWRRWIRNQGDPNVFLGTTIIFPNSVARGEAKGLDARVELLPRAGFSAFATYTLAKIEQTGPINGGLFLEDDIIEIGPGTRFTPDHDQRHALTAQISYEHERRGSWAALGFRYRSGTPLEVTDEELAELLERPGADLVDPESERVKPYAVFDLLLGQRLLRGGHYELSARASVLNLANTRYAFNFGNPFSGTHFGAPRSARVDVRLALR